MHRSDLLQGQFIVEEKAEGLATKGEEMGWLKGFEPSITGITIPLSVRNVKTHILTLYNSKFRKIQMVIRQDILDHYRMQDQDIYRV